MSDSLIFTSRYDVFGPPNGCKGDCEGTGCIPHFERCAASDDADAASAERGRPIVRAAATDRDDPPIYRVLWYLAEAKSPTDDGWHFIRCPDCKPDDPLVQLARAFMRGGSR